MPPSPATLNAVILLFVLVFGACIGSFLNVVIWRMPRGLSIVYPPSHCPGCSSLIAWYDNLPILSWLILRGRCRRCGVRISPRYLVMELLTGLMFVGLYAAYFIFHVRRLGAGPGDWIGLGQFTLTDGGPMFAAHAALLCCLLACSMIDAKYYMIPLGVMWTAAAIGFLACIARPHPMLAAPVTPTTAAAALAAAAGLAAAIYAQHRLWLTPSFIDAGGRAVGPDGQYLPMPQGESDAGVGATSADGINPRVEILREVVFLAPAALLAAGAWLALRLWPGLEQGWANLFDPALHPLAGPRLACAAGSLTGFLLGGLWIWATRILATLAFGREAMGLGDVHILAAVGAVTGWAIPAMAFFLAPVFGLALAIYLMVTRRGRELPYGPWLATGTLAAMLLYDPIIRFFAF